jgi:hypothetical protein
MTAHKMSGIASGEAASGQAVAGADPVAVTIWP